MQLRVLKQKNFAKFATATMTSHFGTFFLNVGLALYVLELTGSAKIFSSVLILGVFPQILLGPIAGALADKFDKKNWVVFFDILRSLICFAMATWAYTFELNIYMIYFSTIFIAFCDVMFNPVYLSILPQIVSKEDRVEANSLNRTGVEVIKVVAPFLSTLVFSKFGIIPILIVNGISFVLSAVAMYKLQFPSLNPTGVSVKFLNRMVSGFQVIRNNTRLASIVTNAFLTNLFILPFIFLGFPFMIVTVYQGDNTVFGIVEGIASLGAISSFFIVPPMKRFSLGANIGNGIVGMFVPVLMLMLLCSVSFTNYLNGNSTLLATYFGLISFLLYLSFTFYLVFFSTFIQETVPIQKLGSFSATVMFFNAIGRAIGLVMFGRLFEISVVQAVAVFGLGMVLKLVAHVPFIVVSRRPKLMDAAIP